jgi:hypothetical protein
MMLPIELALFIREQLQILVVHAVNARQFFQAIVHPCVYVVFPAFVDTPSIRRGAILGFYRSVGAVKELLADIHGSFVAQLTAQSNENIALIFAQEVVQYHDPGTFVFAFSRSVGSNDGTGLEDG